MSPKKAVILYNELSPNPTPDEADVLEQVNIIAENLEKLGIKYSTMTFSLNMKKVEQELLSHKPDFIFNMVEGVDNKGDLIFLAPALLNSLKIPFTGGSLETIFITSSKTLAKERMKQGGLPTAYWYHGEGEFVPVEGKRYIVKPIWEDGSLGLDEDCVFWWHEAGLMKVAKEFNPATHFIEEYIDGREFNISILAGSNGPTVLPHAEIKFYDYEGDKPKMMGWTAKWDENSFEYANTRRTFEMGKNDGELLNKLTELTLKSWDVFKLNGYARVDYRVDKKGNPMVLEINVNPCISMNGGFYAACEQAGISFDEAVTRIINDIPSKK
ncbi:MAG: D-alanine--D-alanine ligase [Bacteroidales bacterium]|nr:D-alanine--D-alanine ligase [Bacteroidales bacterium]